MWVCSCGTINGATLAVCAGCQAPRPDDVPPSPKETAEELVRKSRGPGLAVLYVLGAIAALSAFGLFTYEPPSLNPSLNPPTISKPAVAQVPRAPTVTLAAYLALGGGITYEQSVQIIGWHGTEMSRTTLGGIMTVMYSW